MAKKMPSEINQQHAELIETLRKKDRSFRLAQTIFMMAVIASLILGYFLLFTAFNNQSKQRAQGLVSLNQELNAKVDELTNKIQCLGNFFAQPDRQNLIVKDLNNCFTERLSDGKSLFLTDPGSSQQSNENNNTNGTTSQGENTHKQTPDQNQDQNQPPEAGSGEEVRPPMRVLGIPVCIPFTQICARQ